MKKLLIVSVLCAFVAAPAFGEYLGTFYWTPDQFLYPGAPTVQLNAVAIVDMDYTSFGFTAPTSNGGPFWVQVVQGTLNGFNTLCVESSVTQSLNDNYWASVDDVAYAGRVGSAGDPISNRTEWIYDQYLSNHLKAYTGATISEAIWMGEGEATPNLGNAVWNAAVLAIPDPQVGLATHTRVLNLWTLEKVGDVYVATDVQSHLITVPVPAAVLLGFLGLGYAGMRLRKHV